MYLERSVRFSCFHFSVFHRPVFMKEMRCTVVKPRMRFWGKRKNTQLIKRCDDLLKMLVLFPLYSFFLLLLLEWRCIVSLIVIPTPHKSVLFVLERCSIPCHNSHTHTAHIGRKNKNWRAQWIELIHKNVYSAHCERIKTYKESDGGGIIRLIYVDVSLRLAIFMMNHLRKIL